MKKHRRLNRKGKFLLLVLSTFTLILLVGLVGFSKEEEASDSKKIPAISAEQLSISFEPKKAFGKSGLNKSIQVKKEQARKKAQAKKEAEQRKKDQNSKAIYLTFDDGPSPVTGQLLDILDRYDAKATFFMLGPNIENHPESVNRMVDEGFGVGLHGISHRVQQVYSSKEAPLNEMTTDQDILKKATGVHTELVRLPYGSVPYLTKDMRALLGQSDFKIWDWNVDSRDWELKDERFIQNTISEIQAIEKAGVAPVVLMHDTPATIKYLPELLNFLQKEGYKTKILTNEMPPLTFDCNERCYSTNG